MFQFGECRCCLKKGNHHSLLKKYFVNGKRDNYNNFFIKCFNVFLSSDSSLSTLICISCIKRLRDACSFKLLVLKTEKRLLKHKLKKTEFVNVPLQVDTLESEEVFVKEENESYDDGESRLADDDDDSKSADSEEVDVLVPGEAALLARSPEPRPLPSRNQLFNICPIYFGHLEALKDKIVTTETIKQLAESEHKLITINPGTSNKQRKSVKIKLSSQRRTNSKPKVKLTAISDKLAQALNASTLLENSSATVFKGKIRCGFPCFYCRDIFVNPKSLREHQLLHPKSQLFKHLTRYTADALVVYADITDLKCLICEKDIPNFEDLKIHLTQAHGKKFYKDYTDRIIPFRLGDRENNFDCEVCGRSFETFGATEKHINIHYSNFVCDECGAGFVTKHRLKIHTYLLHSKNKGVRCEPCNRFFANRYKFKIHDENVHKKLRKIQCSHCSEKFIDYFTRQRHMEETHGVERLIYKCKDCDRAFNRKYTLTCHIKRVHLVKKDVQCELCPFMCFNKTELKEHMYKHGTDKSFECNQCQKSFARKKSLQVHMRSHSEDKRFNCHLCGETFAQNSSLKAHFKTHDSEYADL